MADERARIPVAPDYISALGRATYNFAYLEWGITWAWECIDRGSINRVKSLTAGQIAIQFKKKVDKLPNSNGLKNRLSKLAAEFQGFVKLRNALVHANPYTAAGGEQRLRFSGSSTTQDWPVAQIDEFSDHAAKLSIEAGELIHGGLYSAYNSTFASTNKT
jgi:hypothetical protein